MRKSVVFAVIVLMGVCMASTVPADCGKCAPAPKEGAAVSSACGCPFSTAIAGLKLDAKQQAKMDAACAKFRKTVESILTKEQLAEFNAKCGKGAPKEAAKSCAPAATEKK